jgi:CrcB protein
MTEYVITAAAVATGGALGAVLRVAVLRLGKPNHKLPYATFGVNVLGSFFIGWASAGNDPFIGALFMSGVLGGFTTYSTFSVEAASLVKRKRLAPACIYVALTLVACTLAVGAGLAVAEWQGAT